MKRKNRFDKRSKFERSKPRFNTTRRVIIITEGSKTEHLYFKFLQEELKLPNRYLQILTCKGSAPKNVFEMAKRQIQNAGRNEIGEIYCVFDGDRHSTFEEAVSKIIKLSENNKSKCVSVDPVPSIPCFEYWFLLHTRYTRKNYSGVESPCDALIKDLTKSKKFKSYSKSISRSFYNAITESRSSAIDRSKKSLNEALSDNQETYSENPSTRIHIIVEKLLELAVTLQTNSSRHEEN